MTTVQNTIRDAAGSPVAGASVTIRLITGGGAGYTADGDVIGPVTLTADGTGAWSKALPPNSTISPAGTFYEVVESTPSGASATSYFTVPASGGPYPLTGLLVGTPPAPATQYVPVSTKGAFGGVATLDGTGQVPASQLANAPGGSGAVVSVNGFSGAVVLSASSVGALATANNLADVPNAATSRANLGLGNSATRAVGTTAGTVAAGDDSRITGAAQKASNLSDLASASTARTNLGLGGAAVLSVGTTAGTVAAGDDARFSAGGGSGMDQIFPLAGMGLKAAAGDPQVFMGVGGYGNNSMFATRVWIPANAVITNLWVAVRDAGTWDGSTSGNGLALYTDAGVFVDQYLSNSLWTANGMRGGAIGAPVAGQGSGRFVYILPLARGMTTPANTALPISASDNQLPWFSKGLGTRHRCIIIGGSAFPGSFDPTAGSSTTFMPWVGVS